MVRTLCLVPARSGSKGVPNKNFRRFAGTSLTEIAVGVATEVFDKSDVVLSSDEFSAAEIAKRYQINFHDRPKHLARDHSKIAHLIKEIVVIYKLNAEDRMVLLEPSSPLRKACDVVTGLKMLSELGTKAVTSVSRPPVNSQKLLEASNQRLVALDPGKYKSGNRQGLPSQFYADGVFYGFEIGTFIDEGTVPIEGAAFFETGHIVLDINSPRDFELAEMVYERSK